MKILIRFYQKYLSPARFGVNTCRFMPSCSTYMYESIDRFGCVKGVYLGIWRLFRCNPFSHGGYDPVPVRR